jgi:hypothetical protein
LQSGTKVENADWKQNPKTMKKYIYLTLMVFGFQTFLQAQRKPNFSIGLQGVQPVGEFSQVYDGYPIGVSVNFVCPIAPRMPFELGAQYSWNSMGSKSQDVSIFIGTDEQGDDIYEEGSLQVNSNINRFALTGRLRPFNGSVQPYGDLTAGIETYRTKTTIQVVTDNTGYSSGNNADTQQFDMTAYYGWAAGLRLRLAPKLFLDFRFENLSGGAASYVDQDSIEILGEDDIQFETKTSKTDKYTYQVGVTFGF